MRRLFFVLFCLALGTAGRPSLAAAGRPAKSGDILVFAAASTAPALGQLARLHAGDGGPRVRFSFGASSTLARQIAVGAPADIFISANLAWMNYLVERKAVAPGTPIALFANRLVLVVRRQGASNSLPIGRRPVFARILGTGRLAIAEPAHVPAGIYARAALRTLGLWAAVKDRLAPMMDVRAALALVERGEVAAGMVYGSDAHGNERVRTIFEFPRDSHPPIAYLAALMVKRPNRAAGRFLDFLTSPRAKAVFTQFGFSPG